MWTTDCAGATPNSEPRSLPFGSQKQSAFTFTGIELEQLPDHSVRARQKSHLESRLPATACIISPEIKDSPLRPPLILRRSLRGIIGSLQYGVTHTRPDLAARLSEVQSQMSHPTVNTLLEANRILREGQEHKGVSITFQEHSHCRSHFQSLLRLPAAAS